MKKISQYYRQFLESIKKKRFLHRSLDDVLLKFVFSVVFILVVVSMMPQERPFEYSNLTVGSIARDEIIAPFTFPIIKSDKVLEKERRQAALNVPPVFDKREQTADIQKLKIRNLEDELTDFFVLVDKKTKAKIRNKKSWQNFKLADSLAQQIKIKYNLTVSTDDLRGLYELHRSGELPVFFDTFVKLLQQAYSHGIIDRDKAHIEEKSINILQNGVEEEMPVSDVQDVQEARALLLQKLQKYYPPNSFQYSLALKMASSFLIPDLAFNEQLTRLRKDKAIHDVPTTSGFVYKNQRIVDSHEIVTEDIYQKLHSLEIALQERSSRRGLLYHFLFKLGEYLFALTILLILGLYIYYYRPKLFDNNKMLLLITVILLLQFFFSILVANVLKWNDLAIPVTLGPMLLSMLIDAPIAFIGTVIISIVLGASQGNNFYISLLTFVVGTIGLFSVQKIRNRGQMFRAILYIMIGYAIVNFSYGFVHYESFKQMIESFTYYELPNAILAPTAVFLLIGIFERLFDVTTDITLLELSDLNHPLLKRLSVEAPGTFHHSINVGNLAEAAAEAIGANSLLARVGCYYHDIGKMQRAEYFVENQTGNVNKHENLTPTMSSLILVQHVKAGLELADQFKLPKAVKQFIPEHHGTSLMEYFYHKAKETMDAKDINENDFRYPGPKPHSRETAIAMLADTVEAAARSLPNPTPQRLRNLVENLIQKRFQEGQLDECELTLRDLNKIKEAFIPILMGIHHIRIEYPGEDKGEPAEKKSAENAGGKISQEKSKTRSLSPAKSDKNPAGVAPESRRDIPATAAVKIGNKKEQSGNEKNSRDNTGSATKTPPRSQAGDLQGTGQKGD